jgi:hypothetical protein
MSELGARVFVSCGQNKESDELKLAEEIGARLTSLGFSPYIAVGEQSLRGLTENLFEQIDRSEYFLFVDFKRERLEGTGLHRGSLFSHQELAVASFLGIDVLAFQEEGTKLTDGILGFIQANAVPFANRNSLPDLVADSVRQRIQEGRWDVLWRNELVLERKGEDFTDPVIRNTGQTARFFHIGVRNRHRSKTALNCYAYLEKAKAIDSGSEIDMRTAEFKWEGYMLPNAHIHPKTIRRFDAFFVLHGQPTQLQFSTPFCDAWPFFPDIGGADVQFRLTYLVLADNFPPARRSFLLKMSGSLNATTLDAVE